MPKNIPSLKPKELIRILVNEYKYQSVSLVRHRPKTLFQDIYEVDFMKEKDGYEDHWSDQERR